MQPFLPILLSEVVEIRKCTPQKQGCSLSLRGIMYASVCLNGDMIALYKVLVEAINLQTTYLYKIYMTAVMS